MDAFENVKEFSPPRQDEDELGKDDEDEEETDDEEDDDEDGDESGDEEEGDDDELGEDEEWVTDDDDAEDSQDVTLVTSDDDGEGGESCPICLNKFRDQDIGTPESCDHCFCLECIQEWANNVNTCPVDRQVFHLILAKHAYGDRVFKKIPVEDRKIEDEEDEDPTYCEICGRCDREDRLLLCDGCDQGYHCECLTPQLQDIPVEEWFCPDCAQTETVFQKVDPREFIRFEAVTVDDDEEIAEIISENAESLPSLRPQRRLIARTRASERVREQIIELRLRRADREARVTRRRTILLSDDDEDNSQPQAEISTQPSTSGALRKTPTKRKTPKAKRKTRKRKKTTKGAKKTPGKGKGKKKRRRKRKKVTKTSKRKAQIKKLVGKMVSREVRREVVPPASVKSRIAKNLGLSKPPTGTTIPLQKVPTDKGVDTARSNIGITQLSVMGDKNELIGFCDEPGDLIPSASKPSKKSKYSTLALFSHRPVGKPVIKIDQSPAASTGAAGFDLLGSIMDNQEMLGKDSSDVTIHRDGSLSKKAECKPVRKPSGQLLTPQKSQAELYDDLPPLEVSDLNSDLPSPEKETQTAGQNQISDESMKEIKYLDRQVDTTVSPDKSLDLSAVRNDFVETSKDTSFQIKKSNENSIIDNAGESDSNDRSDKNSVNCDIQNSESDLVTEEGSSKKKSLSTNKESGDQNSNSEKSADKSTDSLLESNNKTAKKADKNISNSSDKIISKSNSTTKKIEMASQLDDISDESNGFHDYLEEKELEEKLQQAQEKLRKLENKGKKDKKKELLKEKKKEVLKEKRPEKTNTGKEKTNEIESRKEKSDKVKKKLKESDKSEKKVVKKTKEAGNEKSKEKKCRGSKDEDDIMITTPPPQEIEVIEIPDDDDESEYVQNLDKKIIKSYSGDGSRKTKSRQNLDLRSVVKKEKTDKDEKENRKRRESERDHESDRNSKKKKRYRSRSKSRDRRHRSRSYERSHRSTSRSRDRYKHRRSRSRSRDRSRRSRSRERWSRDRSRDWSRDRSRGRDRSRDRERSRERNRSRDRDRSRSKDRSRKRRHRDKSKDRSTSREKNRMRSRDTSRERRRDSSPQVSLNISSLDSGRLDTGRLIDLFDDKWKKREDLKKSKKKKKDKGHESPIKSVQSPLKRPLEEDNDAEGNITKKSKTPVKEKTPEPVDSVQPIPKIIHVFPEKEKKEIDMFADDNSDMDTDIPEPAQDTVILINTVDNISNSQRPNLVPLPIVPGDDKKDDKVPEMISQVESNEVIPVINSANTDNITVASPEYDPAFPTDDMEESPLQDEKSPPGTPVEYTNPPPQTNLPLIAGEPPRLITVTQPLDEIFPDRVSPLNQLPPQLGKGLLGEGGPLILQRGEAPIIQPQDVQVGIRFLQGIRPGMSPQRAMLMNPVLMNRPPQMQPRFTRIPPGHLPQFGLQVTTQEGVALPVQGQFPPGMVAPGRLPPPQPGLINGSFEGIQPDTSQPPPPFQLLAGAGNHRLPGDPRLQLPPHVLAHGPPAAGAPLHLQPGPGMEQHVSIPSPLVSVSGPPMEGPHLTLQGPPQISLSGPLPRLALPNHPLSVPSSQIRIPSPDAPLGNPLTKLPARMPRLQIPASAALVSVEPAGILERPYTPPTPTNDDTPFMNQAVEASALAKLSRSQSPQTMPNISLLGGKPLMSINLKASKTLQNVNPLLSGKSGHLDEYPSPDENEGDDIIKDSGKTSGNVPQSQSTQLTQLTKLLNAQAQLAQLVSKGKTAKPSSKSGHHKSNDHKFKVPLPPKGKTSNGKVKVGESVDVIDMDVASPLDESSIEIPDSPDDFDKAVFGSKEKENKKRHDKHDRKSHKHKDRKAKASSSNVKLGGSNKKPVMSVNDENLKDVIRELEMDEVPSSAVELTNKEKFLKKLHLQERVVDEVKHALKPFYSQRRINKDQYKEIMRKAVPKVCHSKSGDINPQKIATLVEAYVSKYTKKQKKGEES